MRSVRGSLGRFLAIMGIVALGCGFFAGLRMSGPDMRAAADACYDKSRLWDLRVVSTLGLGEKDLDRLAATEGVEAVLGSTSVDVMARFGTEQVAARVATLPAEYAAEGGAEPELDRLTLRDGRWPSAAGECVASADNPALLPQVGEKIAVLEEAGSGDVLVTHELTVVGTVSSSAYPYTVSFGSTTLGSGMLDQYLFVPAATFAEGTPYTDAHLRVRGAEKYQSDSDAYLDAVGEVAARLEGSADGLAAARLEDVRADAQEEVDAARTEYEEERAATEAQLFDARAELDGAAGEIASGEAQLAEGEAELQSAREQLEASRAQAEVELSAAESELDEAQAQIDSQTATLDAQAPQVEAARAAYDEGVPVLLATLSEQGLAATDLDGAIVAIEGAQAEAATGTQQLEKAIRALEQLEAAGAATPEQLAQLEEAHGQLSALAEASARLQTARDQAEDLVSARDAVSAYDAARTALSEGAAQLQAGREELADRRSETQAQLENAQAQIDASAAQLEVSRGQLEEARTSHDEGLAAWESARAEADARLADAAAQIEDAQAQVDALEAGELYVLDRTQSEGAATYQADSERMDTIATVFPFMFFLVAALVSLTTMTRMVEDERVQIGTYKALGYGTARIAGRYLAYAALASVLGAALGIAVLSQVLPIVVMSAYGIIYAVPQPPLPLPVDPAVALTSGGLGVGVTLVATLAAALSSLRETPSSLMRPRAPKAGKRILLERVRPLWRRISFLRKVAFRNLFRYKERLLMTVLGISGCTALLLVGFGLHDAIWDIIDNQFGPILHYNATVSAADDAGEGGEAAVDDVLSQGGVDVLARVQMVNAQATTDASSGDGLSVQVIVPQDAEGFGDAITLRNRVSHEAIPLADGEIVLTEKAATRLGVSVGDTVTLRGQDAVGNPSGGGCELVVGGVTENYVGNVAYLSPDTWPELLAGDVVSTAEPSFSTIYAYVGDDAVARGDFAEELEATGAVSTVSFTDETVDMYRDMLSAVDMIVVVLIVSAAALAFIVLYNLTNINIGERVREIATLKVLGFKRGEVYAYVFREILLLALLGDVLGLVLGTWLEGFVIVTAEVDVVMFGRAIHAASYAYAFALTLVFSGLVMLAMRRKLDRIDMVESLKSVD